jgi:Tfp pilus assembly protein PilX
MMSTQIAQQQRDGERGIALIMALMVSLVLLFLGMGLLLQTSLGLQASGTDRWVVKSTYAADAGIMMQIQMIQAGAIGAPGSFVLEDNPNIEGFLKGQYTVTVSQFCETRPVSPVLIDGVASSFPEYHVRHFHIRSDAERAIGGLAGLSRASVTADVSSFPFLEERFVEVAQCR